jgi:hypothetical protein
MLALGKFSLLLGIQSRCSDERPFWKTPSGNLALKVLCIVLSLGTSSKGQLLTQWVLTLSTGLAIEERPQVRSRAELHVVETGQIWREQSKSLTNGPLVGKHIKHKYVSLYWWTKENLWSLN